MRLDHMENYQHWTRPCSNLLLVSVTVILVACTTIEPIPLYEPPYDAVAKHGLSAAAFSPSGHLVAVANFNTIWIFETASRDLRVSFSRHERFGTNNTLVFLDEHRIATTAKSDPPGREGFLAAVKIWDINDPYQIPAVIELPELDRYAIALSHSLATGALAVGGQNGAVVLLEPTGSRSFSKKSLPGLSGPVLGLEFNQDGSLLAAGGVHPSIPIWDLGSSSELGSLPAKGTVYDLNLVPGEQAILVSSEDLKLWTFSPNSQPESIKNPSLAGDYFAVGGITATYVVLAVATASLASVSGEYGQVPLPDWPVGDSSEPDYGFCQRETAISPLGDYIVDVHAGKFKEKIRILDIGKNEVVKQLNPRGGKTCGAAFSPDGRSLLIANNRVARLYDTNTWRFEDFNLY